MAKGLEIRRRIKSVKSTRSITKAMQMVAASKMRKAQDQALKTRNYAHKSLEILALLADKMGDHPHYLLSKREGNRCLILLVTANKGLCGSLNSNVLRKTIEFIESNEHKAHGTKPSFQFVTVGKKGRDTLFRLGHKVIADFSDIGDTLSSANVSPVTRHLLDEYKKGAYDRVYIIYSHFISVLAQKAAVRRLVPLGGDILKSMREIMQHHHNDEHVDTSYEYLFEPDPETVLDALLPHFVEMQIYQSLLESQASEQSARMVAMKNATEAAGELMDDLTLTYNKTRQAAITQEISEIVGGVEALKK